MLTSSTFWLTGALTSLLLGAVLLTPLGFVFPEGEFRTSRRAITGGAGIFWLAFSLIMTQTMWHGYYGYIYPAWMKWGILPVAVIIFPGMAFVFHWLACRLPGHPLGWFCLFTGLHAVAEHTIAWMGGLPEKVPYLNGAPPVPVLVFAFFEYQIYWAVALWLAWFLVKLAERRKGTDTD